MRKGFIPPEGVNWRIKERYELAREIVLLIDNFQREYLGGISSGLVNWNATIVQGRTDSLESLILMDIFGRLGPMPFDSSLEALHVEAKERIKKLFDRYKSLVAELELSGLKYQM